MKFEPGLPQPRDVRHVLIVGCGFSGALQAINLLRHAGPTATIVERSPVAGTGVAYSTLHPAHLLNVRAAKMSAFPDQPGHFVQWLEAAGEPYTAQDFVPRSVYGRYLQATLSQAVEGSAGRLQLIQGDAERIHYDGQVRLSLADGREVRGDCAVLAVGNLPPHDPEGLDSDALGPALYQRDPWKLGAMDDVDLDADVLLLGTGLTMVDVCLWLRARNFRGRIVALSRRGLVPHRHDPPHASIDARLDRPRPPLSSFVRDVRARAKRIGWQQAVDELRPMTQALWRSLSVEERRRFLRHLRPWWDVHRHRIAPSMADLLADMQASGQLSVVAGKILHSEEADGRARVIVRPRGSSKPDEILVDRIVNCTGPQGDILRSDEPLLRNMIADGLLSPDVLRIGVDVNPQGRTVRADGGLNDWLYAVGPLTRGAFWEIVAVPDIRSQTWTVARQLSNAHWVGGEGL